MSHPKKQNPSSGDRHKPGPKMVRIRERLHAQAEQLARQLEQDVTQVVNDALRQRLEREGFWPPRGKP